MTSSFAGRRLSVAPLVPDRPRSRQRGSPPAAAPACGGPDLRGDPAREERPSLGPRERDVARPLPAGDHGPGRAPSSTTTTTAGWTSSGEERALRLLQAQGAAPQRPLQEQPRRHLHRRHREGRGGGQRLRHGRGGRGLRQRRLPRPLRHRLRPLHPLPQQRRRHLHRRDREGRGGRAGLDHERRLVRLRQRRPARPVRCAASWSSASTRTSSAATTSWASASTASPGSSSPRRACSSTTTATAPSPR